MRTIDPAAFYGGYTELRDVVHTPYIRHYPTVMDMAGTAIRQPSRDEIGRAVDIYRRETGGFAGEMTQYDLNRYLDILRSREMTYG